MRGVHLGPSLRRRDIGNGCIEPHVEYFAFVSGLRHWHTPIEIARDAAIPDALLQPLFDNRRDERRPAGPAFDPTLKLSDQSGLTQEEMARRAKLEVCASGQRRA